MSPAQSFRLVTTRSQPRRPARASGPHHISHMRIGLVTQHAAETNLGLAAAAPPGIRSFLFDPGRRVRELDAGRRSARPPRRARHVDGIEPGLAQLELLERAASRS